MRANQLEVGILIDREIVHVARIRKMLKVAGLVTRMVEVRTAELRAMERAREEGEARSVGI